MDKVRVDWQDVAFGLIIWLFFFLGSLVLGYLWFGTLALAVGKAAVLATLICGVLGAFVAGILLLANSK